MKKKTLKKKVAVKKKVGLGKTMLTVGFIVAFLVTFTVASANVSFMDRVAQIAGNIIGVNVSAEISDQIGNIADINFGATAGPDRYNPCEKANGVERCFNRSTLKTSTTTVCAFKSPAATSTLVSGSVKFTTSSTTAMRVTLAKAASAFATTTDLGTNTLAASAQGSYTVSATSTSPSVDVATTFAPNTYFVVGMADGSAEATAGSFSPTGSCNATFEVI